MSNTQIQELIFGLRNYSKEGKYIEPECLNPSLSSKKCIQIPCSEKAVHVKL